MLGTNDARRERSAAGYAHLSVSLRLLDNGTIVILSTIPPIFFDPAGAGVQRRGGRIAEQHRLPVIDYYGEILARGRDDGTARCSAGRRPPHRRPLSDLHWLRRPPAKESGTAARYWPRCGSWRR
jgi:hypothetical protein